MECINRIRLAGKMVSLPVYDHTVLGEAFYKMLVSAKRLSGTADLLPVTVSERLMDTEREGEPGIGSAIEIEGQLRSYNHRDENGSHLIITVFARDVFFPDEELVMGDENYVELAGHICKPVVYRTTPFQREISDVLLAVGRRYGKSDYLPCIAWGRNARYAGELSVNDMLLIRGRMQSREYQKTLPDGSVEQRTAYEISISALERIEDQSF